MMISPSYQPSGNPMASSARTRWASFALQSFPLRVTSFTRPAWARASMR